VHLVLLSPGPTASCTTRARPAELSKSSVHLQLQHVRVRYQPAAVNHITVYMPAVVYPSVSTASPCVAC